MHVLLPSETLFYNYDRSSILFFRLIEKIPLYHFSGLATLGVDVSIVSTGGVNVKHDQGMVKSQ